MVNVSWKNGMELAVDTQVLANPDEFVAAYPVSCAGLEVPPENVVDTPLAFEVVLVNH